MSEKLGVRLVRLANGVYFVRGKEPMGNENAPTVILIFGWMGAKPVHLLKYTQKYDELYPDATQILITCEPSNFWIPQSKRHARLAPVVDLLLGLNCLSSTSVHANPAQPRILLHAFSNGGCLQLSTLSEYISYRGHKSPHLTSALVIDSAPGHGGFKTARVSLTGAIRNPILRWGAVALVSLVVFTVVVCHNLFGYEGPIEKLYKRLKRPNVFPWMDWRTPRLYVFSKKDQLVPWHKVWEHADESEKAGVAVVEKEFFEESAHVNHARADPVRYWTSVQRIWNLAM